MLKNTIKISILLILFFNFSPIVWSKLNKGYYAHKTLKRDSISDGVIYSHILVGQRERKHSVHIIECNLNKKNSIQILKAENNSRSLSKIHKMVKDFDSLNISSEIIGAINANFWRAVKKYPIGPTIIDGEIIEKYRYKRWTSFLIDSTGIPYIDTFNIHTNFKANGKELEIYRINRRMDSTNIILYNKYYGENIPMINEKETRAEFELYLMETLMDTTFNDSTEIVLDTNDVKQQIREIQKRNNIEFSYEKVQLTYLDKPILNSPISCLVTAIDTGEVIIPNNGCVISFGNNRIDSIIDVKIGDIVEIQNSTNIYKNINFKSGICATPRLVRKGISSHDAYKEGSRGRRFIHKRLARTAIGYNKSKTKVFLVVVDNSSKTLHYKGADLYDLSAIMKTIGCYDAMNLDGGGSSYMVIDGKNIKYKSYPNRGRKVSTSIGVKVNK